jgi:hypothetical protein
VDIENVTENLLTWIEKEIWGVDWRTAGGCQLASIQSRNSTSGLDGFGAKEFHRCCDGRANTLTPILDTKGNIFGGFAPVEWESGNQWKGDDSLQAEESARRSGEEIRAEAGKEAESNQMLFRMESTLWQQLHSCFQELQRKRRQ